MKTHTDRIQRRNFNQLCPFSKRKKCRRNLGITLVELLVILGIISLLISITIPAVLGAREAARKTHCINNLKQLGVAINGHLSSKGYLPREENTYSSLVFLLPFLEQKSLFDSLNFTRPRVMWKHTGDANLTAFKNQVNVFLCPSDSSSFGLYGPTNYGGNLGVGTGKYNRPANGPFASSLGEPQIKEGWIRDGFSNTIAMSEFCRTNSITSNSDSHPIFALGHYSFGDMNKMLADCKRTTRNDKVDNATSRGECWGYDGLRYSSYDHNLSPNDNTCSSSGITQGAWTANSHHSGGVNCLHLDGHVSFIGSSIALPTWNSLGTMNGGEIVQAEQH